MKQFETAIALFAWRRPLTTIQVLQAILRQNPARLYVFIDGPATDSDKLLVEEVYQAVIKMVPPDCKLILQKQPTHVPLGKQLWQGLDYLFKNEEQALIFEDDTVPADSFFDFAAAMLQKYKQQEEVIHISGCNLNAFEPTAEPAYLQTPFAMPCWGWASWARAWKNYDFYMKDWIQYREQVGQLLGEHAAFYLPMLDKYATVLRSWDVQWQAAIWQHAGKAILPTQNMVTNIGFDSLGTFTAFTDSNFSNLKFETEAKGADFIEIQDTERAEKYAAAIKQLIREIGAKTVVKPAGNYNHGN